MTVQISVDEIQVLEDVYPRDSFDNETVNNYRMNVDKLPPIKVSNEKILIDGYHRLLAHRLAEKTEIEVEFLDVAKDRILWEATRLNSKHGKQLRRIEKRRLARHFYENNGCTPQEISDALAVSTSTLSNWLSDLIQQAKEEQKRQIIDLYLQCLTHQKISDKVELSRSRVSEIVEKFRKEFSDNPPESLQLFNVWTFHKRDPQYGLAMEGAIPGQIVENVLYYYTEPFDVVVDPMAGSGTTIDVCKAMNRRYRAYDIEPKREEIQKHDIQNGYSKECRNCDLIFLDPPYHNMVFDSFKTVDEFYEFVRKLAVSSFKTVKKNGIVAFLMQDMTEKGRYCLSGESYSLFRKAGFECYEHVSCPLSTQQFLPQQVERAKKEKRMLGRNRDLYVFRKT